MATTDLQQTATRNDSCGVGAALARPGGLSYLEIPAIDIRRSAEFYRAVAGWNSRGSEADPAPSKFSDPGGHLIGRWVTGRVIAREAGLLPYVYVDSVDRAVEAAAAHGGEVVQPPRSEGNLRVATVRDPAGNLIGLWQEAGR